MRKGENYNTGVTPNLRPKNKKNSKASAIKISVRYSLEQKLAGSGRDTMELSSSIQMLKQNSARRGGARL